MYVARSTTLHMVNLISEWWFMVEKMMRQSWKEIAIVYGRHKSMMVSFNSVTYVMFFYLLLFSYLDLKWIIMPF